jgi:hypothetical protein
VTWVAVVVIVGGRVSVAVGFLVGVEVGGSAGISVAVGWTEGVEISMLSRVG